VRRVLLSAACDVLLALVVSRGAIAGIAPVLPGSVVGNCYQAVALVPAAARVLPHAAGSDDGIERTSRGRDILESWSFSFQIRAPFVVVPV
jgi:hypothetical protein